jgi:hypothetical protein
VLHELVTNAGRVQERLFEALPYLHRIRPIFPKANCELGFSRIKDDLAFEPKCNQDNLLASFRAIADNDASDIAWRMLRLHYELEEGLDQLR